MKKGIRLVCIIVFAVAVCLLPTSCGETGGTFIIKNETGDEIRGFVVSGYYTEIQIKELQEGTQRDSTIGRTQKTIYTGTSETWTFNKNDYVTWGFWVGDDLNYGGVKKLEKGDELTVEAKL